MADHAPIRPVRAADLPALPLDHLPTPLRNLVTEVSRMVDVDISMPCMMATAMLASLYQSRVEVEVSPGHCEPLCVYASVLANPGERKTSTMNAIIGSVRSASVSLHPYWRTEQSVRERQIMDAKERVQKLLETPQGRNPNNIELQNAIKEANQTGGLKQFILEDMTPAAFIQSLSISPTALILSDEGEVWKKLSGSGTSDDIGLWLRAHTGETYIKNRKTQEPVYIERPVASVLLAMQPGIIRACSNIRGLSDQGLVARFIWCVSKSRIGHRQVGHKESNPQVLEEFKEWGTRIRTLIADHRSKSANGEYKDLVKIKLSPGAADIWNQWASLIEYELRSEVNDEFPKMDLLPQDIQGEISLGNTGTYCRVSAAASKAAGATARIAGAMAADRIYTGGEPARCRDVLPEEMLAAVRFMFAQMEHCKAVRDLMDGESADDQYAIINHFSDSGWPEKCKKGWLIQVAKDVCQNRDSAEAAVAHLIERGYFHYTTTTELRSNSHLITAQSNQDDSQGVPVEHLFPPA